jgi:hypothetical protein
MTTTNIMTITKATKRTTGNTPEAAQQSFNRTGERP